MLAMSTDVHFTVRKKKNLSMKCFIPERIFDRLVIENLIV